MHDQFLDYLQESIQNSKNDYLPVRFIKQTILPNGKVSYKESMGRILSFNREYAVIIDNVGDITQNKLCFIKSLDDDSYEKLANISSL